MKNPKQEAHATRETKLNGTRVSMSGLHAADDAQRTAPLERGNSLEIASEREATLLSVLLDGKDSLDIDHSGEIYVLRLTRAKKLILTKRP